MEEFNIKYKEVIDLIQKKDYENVIRRLKELENEYYFNFEIQNQLKISLIRYYMKLEDWQNTFHYLCSLSFNNYHPNIDHNNMAYPSQGAEFFKEYVGQKDHVYFYVQGLYELNKKNYSESINSFQTALNLIPQQNWGAHCYAKMALNYQYLDKQEQKKDCLNRAISILPQDELVLNTQAIIMEEEKKYLEAFNTYEKLISLYPHNQHVYLDLQGDCLYYEGQVQESLKYFHKSIKAKPDYYYPYFNLAYCYSQQGNKATAIVYYKKTLEIKPDHVYCLKNLSICYGKLDQKEEQIKTQIKLFQFQTYKDLKNLENITFNLLQSRKYKESLEFYEEYFKLEQNQNIVLGFIQALFSSEQKNWLPYLFERAEKCEKYYNIVQKYQPLIEAQSVYYYKDPAVSKKLRQFIAFYTEKKIIEQRQAKSEYRLSIECMLLKQDQQVKYKFRKEIVSEIRSFYGYISNY